MKKFLFVTLAVFMTLAMVGLVSCGDSGGGGGGGPAKGKVRVTFNANGGQLNATFSGNYIDIDKDTAVGIANWPIPTKLDSSRPGFGNFFEGWKKDGVPYEANTPIGASITLKAEWGADVVRLPPTITNFDETTIFFELSEINPNPAAVNIGVQASNAGNAAMTYTWYVTRERVTTLSEETLNNTNGAGRTGLGATYSVLRLPSEVGGDPYIDLDEPGVYYFYVGVYADADNFQSVKAYAGPRMVVVRGLFEPSIETVEKISVRNASIPLYKFELPEGAAWEDYIGFSIDYYVTADKLASAARTRLYGPFVDQDLRDTEGSTLNASYSGSGIEKWYGLGDNTLADYWRVVADQIAAGVSNNNSFIMDGRTGKVSELKADEWVNMEYSMDGTQKDDAMPDTYLLKNREEDTVYFGPYLLGGGGDQGTLTVYYARHVILIHGTDTTKYIEGVSVPYWALNNSPTGIGVYRRVVTEVPEGPFVCHCKDDQNPETHDCQCLVELGECTKEMCGECEICFPPCSGCTFDDCYCEGACDCAECAAELATKLTALKALDGITQADDAKLDSGVASMLLNSWNDVFWFTFADAGINPDFTKDTVIVNYQLVQNPGTTGVKKVVVKAGANVTSPDMNPAQYVDLAAANERTKTGQIVVDLTTWPAAGTDKTGISFQNNPQSTNAKYYIKITSVTIKAAPGGGGPGKITFGPADTTVQIVANGSNSAPGTISYNDGAYTYDRNGGGWGNQIAYFTINFGPAKLSDYTDIKFNIKTTGDAGYKNIYVLADTDMVALNEAGLTDTQRTDLAVAQSDGQVADVSDYDADFEITGAQATALAGESVLDFAIYLHSNATQVITISDFEFVLK
jgi:hypothetical protein